MGELVWVAGFPSALWVPFLSRPHWTGTGGWRAGAGTVVQPPNTKMSLESERAVTTMQEVIHVGVSLGQTSCSVPAWSCLSSSTPVHTCCIPPLNHLPGSFLSWAFPITALSHPVPVFLCSVSHDVLVRNQSEHSLKARTPDQAGSVNVPQ